MKLSELITPAIMENQEIIANKKYTAIYMVYSKKLQAWVWCDHDGKVITNMGGLTKKVELTREIIEDDNWFIYGYPESKSIINHVLQEVVESRNTEELSNALEKVNVCIQNRDGSFRSIYDVLKDLSDAHEIMESWL